METTAAEAPAKSLHAPPPLPCTPATAPRQDQGLGFKVEGLGV